MIILDSACVEEHLKSTDCVELMEKTLYELAEGSCVQYLRTAINLPNTNVLGLMPGWFDGYFGVKTISVYHTNRGSGYPSHQGQILLFESEHGSLLAGIDATSVTKIRTGAVSAVATRLLARPDSSRLCILGCGTQGESHIDAIVPFFDIKTITLWDAFPEAAGALAAKAGEGAARGIDIRVCDTAEEAVRDADIICTVTPSALPVLCGSWLKSGAHINAVGACAPNARELDSEAVRRAAFFGDSIDSVEHESGDYLFPLKEGVITREHLRGTIGDILLKKIPGRESDDQITVFEALGLAVEDIAAAKYLYDRVTEND
ncbi:MAG: ornithine cyclodeaminase family protein [Lachnospiraceae bacterium]|nr:ornithine cyclodeaminase family protein [Lachnospiraceae bacterium]